jgi:hypothetical protein
VASVEAKYNTGNLHDMDTYVCDEIEQAQEGGLELDSEGWPIVFGLNNCTPQTKEEVKNGE